MVHILFVGQPRSCALLPPLEALGLVQHADPCSPAPTPAPPLAAPQPVSDVRWPDLVVLDLAPLGAGKATARRGHPAAQGHQPELRPEWRSGVGRWSANGTCRKVAGGAGVTAGHRWVGTLPVLSCPVLMAGVDDTISILCLTKLKAQRRAKSEWSHGW